jgi:hypothetical protein
MSLQAQAGPFIGQGGTKVRLLRLLPEAHGQGRG